MTLIPFFSPGHPTLHLIRKFNAIYSFFDTCIVWVGFLIFGKELRSERATAHLLLIVLRRAALLNWLSTEIEISNSGFVFAGAIVVPVNFTTRWTIFNAADPQSAYLGSFVRDIRRTYLYYY